MLEQVDEQAVDVDVVVAQKVMHSLVVVVVQSELDCDCDEG